MATRNSINTTGPGVMQVLTQTISANNSYSALFPVYDGTIIGSNDTIPQQTDGTEILSLSITPKYSTSKIFIEFRGNGIWNILPFYFNVYALFKDSDANALAATSGLMGFGNNFFLAYQESSASTTTRTYKIRIGPTRAGFSTAINGADASRFGGGTMTCRVTIYEIMEAL